MKKTTLAEDTREDFQTFFEPPSGDFAAGRIAVSPGAGPPPAGRSSKEASLLDGLLTAVKWTFLYFPGAAAVHVIMMGFALLFLYDGWGAPMWLGTLGIFAASTFMIMLGIGKLRDLKYLRVVLGIFLTSSLCGVLYAVLAVFIPGDFFGLFAKITLPATLAVGYLVKRKTDREAGEPKV